MKRFLNRSHLLGFQSAFQIGSIILSVMVLSRAAFAQTSPSNLDYNFEAAKSAEGSIKWGTPEVRTVGNQRVLQIKGTTTPETIIVSRSQKIKVPRNGQFSITTPVTSDQERVPIQMIEKNGNIRNFTLNVAIPGGASASAPVKPPSPTVAPPVPTPELTPTPPPPLVAETEKIKEDEKQAKKDEDTALKCDPVHINGLQQSSKSSLKFDPKRNGVVVGEPTIRFDLTHSDGWIIADQPFPKDAFEVKSRLIRGRVYYHFTVPIQFPKLNRFYVQAKSGRKNRKFSPFILPESEVSVTSVFYRTTLPVENGEDFRICGLVSDEENVGFCSPYYVVNGTSLKRLNIKEPPYLKIRGKRQTPEIKSAALKEVFDVRAQLPNGSTVEISEGFPSPVYTDVVMDRQTNTITLRGKGIMPAEAIQEPDSSEWKITVPFRSQDLAYFTSAGLKFYQRLDIKKCLPTEQYRVYVSANSVKDTYRDAMTIKLEKPQAIQVRPLAKSAEQIKEGRWTFKLGEKGETVVRSARIESSDEKFIGYYSPKRGFPAEVGGHFSTIFNISGVSGETVNAFGTYWFEDIFNMKNTTWSLQRWGVHAHFGQRIYSTIHATVHDESALELSLNYRLTPGLIYQDKSFMLVGKVMQRTLDGSNSIFLEAGGRYSTPPFWYFKDILNFLGFIPFFDKPKWMDLSLTFRMLDLASGSYKIQQAWTFQGETKFFLKPNLNMFLSGNMEYLEFSGASFKSKRLQALFNYGFAYEF